MYLVLWLLKLFNPGNGCNHLTVLTTVVIFGNCFGAFASFVIEALALCVCDSQIDATVKAADFQIVVFLLRMFGV